MPATASSTSACVAAAVRPMCWDTIPAFSACLCLLRT